MLEGKPPVAADRAAVARQGRKSVRWFSIQWQVDDQLRRDSHGRHSADRTPAATRRGEDQPVLRVRQIDALCQRRPSGFQQLATNRAPPVVVASMTGKRAIALLEGSRWRTSSNRAQHRAGLDEGLPSVPEPTARQHGNRRMSSSCRCGPACGNRAVQAMNVLAHSRRAQRKRS